MSEERGVFIAKALKAHRSVGFPRRDFDARQILAYVPTDSDGYLGAFLDRALGEAERRGLLVENPPCCGGER